MAVHLSERGTVRRCVSADGGAGATLGEGELRGGGVGRERGGGDWRQVGGESDVMSVGLHGFARPTLGGERGRLEGDGG